MTSSIANKLVCFFVIGILGCSSMMGIMSMPSINQLSSEEESSTRIDSSSGVNPMSDWLIPDDDENLVDMRDYLDLYRENAVTTSHYSTSKSSDISSGFEFSFTAENDHLSIEAIVEDYGIATYSFDEGAFNALVIPNMDLSNTYGEPVLPYKKLMFNIPDGKEVLEVRVTSVSTEQIFGLKLVPGPKPVAIYGDLGPDPTLFFEPTFYSSNSMLPFDIIESQVVYKGDEQALMVTVSPLQYNPVLKQGVLHSEISIDVHFSDLVTTEEVTFQGWSNYDGANYTIITTATFLPILSDFIDWKTSIGFDVQVETVEDILTGFSGRDNPEKVRTFITAAYTENNTGYFLLIGDCDIVPVREVWDPANAGQGLDNGTLPSDFYYECLDGTWDDNGNDVFGEFDDDVDLFPEVKVGRLPVQLPSEAEHVLTQIISYESEPQDGDWMNDFMLIAVDCFGSGDGVVMSEGELNQKYLFDSFYDVFRYYPTDGSLSNTAILAKMNSGVGIVDFFDHGAYDVWVDAMDFNDALNLENSNKSFFAFAMACETAAFDVESVEPTIGEAFFRAPLGGASTYIGATRIAWAGEDCFDGFHNHFWDFFMNAALANHEARPKDAFHESLNYMATTFDTTNGPTLEVFYQAIYFGDPALVMYWKHNVTTTAEIVEVDEAVTVNGTCLLYNNRPIVDSVDVTVKDSIGDIVYSGTTVTDSEGKYSIGFIASISPGEYMVETTITEPFEYIAVTTFRVGTLDVSFSLDNNAIYNTFLNFTGTVANDCSGSVILLDDQNVEISSKVITSSGGVFSDSVNLTDFGPLRLLVQFDNGTATGGYHIYLKVIKGEILIIADNAGGSGPDYPGGWADHNFGDASNPGDYVLALKDEYNVTVFWTMHETAPTISLLNQYDVVIVTTGDNEGNPLNAPDAYLLDVLQDYHDSGGDIVFEGGAILSALQAIELSRFPNLFHVSFTGPISNTGSSELAHTGHQIMSGLPTTIPLADGLGADEMDSFDPANGSVHVAGYSGHSGIAALSPVSGVGGIVFIGFAIDAITNSDNRNLLIQNAMDFLLQPSLKITLSDDAMQTGTSETIYIEITDSATGTPIEGVSIDLDGCGVSVSNTSKADGTCSVLVSPSSAGLITINVTKVGYLNYSTFITVYDLPVVSLETSPDFLERSTMTRVTITATDYYEHNPLDNCFVNISGLGIIESGYTNTSGMIDFDLYTD
ncbi:hypothetical protein EU528_09590, partial [Candidatus Thorarchaeota archaeon]